MEEIRRIVGVIINPRATFRGIVTHPRWMAPFLLITFCSVAYTFTMDLHVGWETLIRNEVEQSSRLGNLTPAQKEQYVQDQVPIWNYTAYLYGALGPGLEAIVAAAGLFVIFFDSFLTFRKTFAIVTYSLIPGSLGSIIGAVTVLLKNPHQVDPGRVLPLNASFFLPDYGTMSPWLVSVLQSLDILSIWTVVLLATGFWITSKSRSFGMSLAFVAAAWLAYLGIRAVIFSSIGTF